MDRKKTFFIWKIILTIISLGCVILTKSQINWHNLTQIIAREIIYDLSVGVFSAMILIWFIDEINEHIQDQKN